MEASKTIRNQLAPDGAGSVKKMEWVTPKISLMGAGDTEAKTNTTPPAEISLGEGPS